jgi:hypothetical protein
MQKPPNVAEEVLWQAEVSELLQLANLREYVIDALNKMLDGLEVKYADVVYKVDPWYVIQQRCLGKRTPPDESGICRGGAEI